MKKLAVDNFNPVSGFYHYHSMNKGFYEQLVLGNGEMNLKAFFYAALKIHKLLTVNNASFIVVEFYKV